MSVETKVTGDPSNISTAPSRKRRRLIPRFRLRTLFVATVLMSLLLGWYGRHVYRVRQERAAAEALRRVGAQLTMPTFEYAGATLPADLYGWFPWFYVEEHTSVSLDSADGASDADLAHASRLPGLTWIRLTGADFTDQGLRNADDFRSLSSLCLESSSVTGDGLAAFGGRKRLAFLEFNGSASGKSARIFERIDALPNLTTVRTWREPLTVEGMRATAKLEHLTRLDAYDVPRIESGALGELAKARRLEQLRLLPLPNRPLGDEALVAVSGIESVQVLAISCSQATDSGFAKLVALPNLRELHVLCPNVTDAGVEALAGVKTLEQITMSHYALTDRSLHSLRGLPNLAKVVLPGGVSREAAQRFANDRPQCAVWYPHPGSWHIRLEPEIADEAKTLDGDSVD